MAYDEPEYQPKKWWRGPTWLAPAYLCLEVLEKKGYEKEHKEAATKLYNMIVADGRISELFNSQTGEGIGNSQQGWTAAILLKMELN